MWRKSQLKFYSYEKPNYVCKWINQIFLKWIQQCFPWMRKCFFKLVNLLWSSRVYCKRKSQLIYLHSEYSVYFYFYFFSGLVVIQTYFTGNVTFAFTVGFLFKCFSKQKLKYQAYSSVSKTSIKISQVGPHYSDLNVNVYRPKSTF